MKSILCFIGIVCTILGILSIVFYEQVSSILTLRQSYGITLLGGGLIYIGREYLFCWLIYFFSGEDGGDYDDG